MTLVFGYRNTSCLVFERGKLVGGDTTNLGFYRLLEEILKLTSGQNRNQLVQTVYQLGDDLTVEHDQIRSLCRSQQPENQEREAREIVQAIEQARNYYWGLVKLWLVARVPQNINEIVISGGTAKYLYSYLSHHFSEIRTYWGTDWQEQIENEPKFTGLDLHELDRGALAYRLVDVYAQHSLQSKDKVLETQARVGTTSTHLNQSQNGKQHLYS